MKKTFLLLSTTLTLAAAPFAPNFTNQPKIAVQNAILAQVNGKTISMMDVKKKMDMVFHQSYPQLIDSTQSRLQFYEASWRHVLMDLIDNELILADAADKEVKVSDGEIREVMEGRFGPNIMQTLDKLDLTYEEAWKMIKNEMIVQRMNWWFVHSKATSSVTPQDIRQAYRLYLKANPAYTEWTYKVVSLRVDEPNDALAENAYKLLSESGKAPDEATLKSLEAPGVAISISNEFVAKTQDLSEVHKTALEPLAPATYSKPSFQLSRADKKTVYRILYLIGKNDFPAPSFEVLFPQLQGDLMQKAVVQEGQEYIQKLRKRYGFEESKAIPEDLHPFALQ
jgi:hypothetical protein